MKTHENRSDFIAHESQIRGAETIRAIAPWTLPSRCKRPPLAKPLTLFDKLLKLVGLQ